MVRKKIHQLIWVLLAVFCILGFFYPVIGLAAVICMLAPSVYALFKGNRGWCGTYCPRGSFSDVILSRLSFGKSIPRFLKTKSFRIVFFILLMSLFAVQLVVAWGDLKAVGGVFVRMILVTTAITIMLGLFYKPRTWCHFCPMGTMAHYVSKGLPKHEKSSYVQFDTSLCVNCKKCSKACPMSIDLLLHKESCIVSDADCIKCGQCVGNCPRDSLKLLPYKKVG